MIPPAGAVARSRNLGHTFLANSVVHFAAFIIRLHFPLSFVICEEKVAWYVLDDTARPRGELEIRNPVAVGCKQVHLDNDVYPLQEWAFSTLPASMVVRVQGRQWRREERENRLQGAGEKSSDFLKYKD